ncbi:alkane 1-monooxygenase [Lacinutrix jangbogonensis]|uniref:alkane 1-monooxygenase n=1 Tax=Lacinutrix jangbogonensis TaxID=1469557 RepID=UPI00053ECC0E|nr:alkane 1-monooxygenase [Lacinutrix jangbogonensis]
MIKFKYFAAYIIPLLGLLTFNTTGIYAYIGLFILYVLIPVLEQILPNNTYNLNDIEKGLAKKDVFFDLVLYLSVPLHLFVGYQFLITVSSTAIPLSHLIACILMMGTILGVNGINIGHELGHKTEHPVKQILAHIMLLTSLQNHFIPYHNGGHHRDVATPDDYTSAKEGSIFYFFAIRSQIGGYFKTWKLEAQRLKAQGKNAILNPMIIYTLLPVLLLFSIFYFFGLQVMFIYFITSVIGISILEAQNYFAHYGLRRKMQDNGRYERVKPKHSWNSDHIIGRVLLFELTRHSDHHHMGAKPYHLLDSKENSPNLPYGYPAMLVLSYFPFLFRPIMKKQLELYGVG